MIATVASKMLALPTEIIDSFVIFFADILVATLKNARRHSRVPP